MITIRRLQSCTSACTTGITCSRLFIRCWPTVPRWSASRLSQLVPCLRSPKSPQIGYLSSLGNILHTNFHIFKQTMTSWWECCAAQIQKSLVCADVRVSRRTESCLRRQGSFWKNEWIEENVKETGCWGARERWCFILFVVFFTKLSMKLKKNNCLLIWFPGPLDTWYKNILIIIEWFETKIYHTLCSDYEFPWTI